MYSRFRVPLLMRSASRTKIFIRNKQDNRDTKTGITGKDDQKFDPSINKYTEKWTKGKLTNAFDSEKMGNQLNTVNKKENAYNPLDKKESALKAYLGNDNWKLYETWITDEKKKFRDSSMEAWKRRAKEYVDMNKLKQIYSPPPKMQPPTQLKKEAEKVGDVKTEVQIEKTNVKKTKPSPPVNNTTAKNTTVGRGNNEEMWKKKFEEAARRKKMKIERMKMMTADQEKQHRLERLKRFVSQQNEHKKTEVQYKIKQKEIKERRREQDVAKVMEAIKKSNDHNPQ